jgi:hypothetical protein
MEGGALRRRQKRGSREFAPPKILADEIGLPALD